MSADPAYTVVGDDPRDRITVVTPTVLGREGLLAECRESVQAAGLTHLVGLDMQHEGPAVMRNRLVEQVRTEWVVFLDDDDLIYPHYADVVGKWFASADFVWTGWDLEGARDPLPVPFDPALQSWRNTIPVTVCVKTEVFRAEGGFNPDAVLEDYELWRQIQQAWDFEGLRMRWRMVFEPTPAWRYRRQPDSRSNELEGGAA